MALNTIDEILEDLRRGKMAVIMDDEDRENEGDLIMAAERVRPEDVNFMARYGRGLICLTLTRDRCRQLRLPLMVSETDISHRTNFTLSIEAAEGVTTGISAHDRAHTVRTLADPQAMASSFRRPGHVLPLKAREGGARARRGHTEAAVELCRLAGKNQAAAICEMIVDGEPVPGRTELNGGRMMRRDDCLEFGKKWGIKVCTIEDLVNYVESREGKLKAK